MEFKRIGIMHLNQIGDLLFALPMLKALREHAPGATIHSYVKPYLKELLETSSLADQIRLAKGIRCRALRYPGRLGHIQKTYPFCHACDVSPSFTPAYGLTGNHVTFFLNRFIPILTEPLSDRHTAFIESIHYCAHRLHNHRYVCPFAPRC